jgi:hypothetical protein
MIGLLNLVVKIEQNKKGVDQNHATNPRRISHMHGQKDAFVSVIEYHVRALRCADMENKKNLNKII